MAMRYIHILNQKGMLIEFKNLFERHNYFPKGIVHCGSSTGQERFAYAELGVPVIWIEAILEVYMELLENIRPFNNQKAVHACLGEVDGKEVTFNVSNNEAQSSSYLQLDYHKIAHPEVEYVRSFTTSTTTLKKIIETYDFDINDWLLVADLQGSEMNMLQGAYDILPKFNACYLEVNTKTVYEKCALKNEVEDFLLGYGFTPAEEFIYEQWGWGDQFFLKTK